MPVNWAFRGFVILTTAKVRIIHDFEHKKMKKPKKVWFLLILAHDGTGRGRKRTTALDAFDDKKVLFRGE